MSNQKVTPERFEKAMMDILSKYGDDSFKVCEAEAKASARSAVSTLKGSAPSGGEYARGWTHKTVKGRASCAVIVHNRDYRLPHLLENPHATGRHRSGHYPRRVDYTGTIARVEDDTMQKFIEGVERKL